MEIDDQLDFVDDIDVKELDSEERVEIPSIENPVYKTLEQIYQEKEF